MTHTEAVSEMKKLARGKHWSLKYEVGDFYDPAAIRGYIEGVGSALDAYTYAGAIENVKVMLGLVPCDPAPEDGTDASRPYPAESGR